MTDEETGGSTGSKRDFAFLNQYLFDTGADPDKVEFVGVRLSTRHVSDLDVGGSVGRSVASVCWSVASVSLSIVCVWVCVCARVCAAAWLQVAILSGFSRAHAMRAMHRAVSRAYAGSLHAHQVTTKCLHHASHKLPLRRWPELYRSGWPDMRTGKVHCAPQASVFSPF